MLAEGAHAYLENVRSECAQIHSAIQQIYFDYSIESELASFKQARRQNHMAYSVRHITSFRYEPAVRESVMEVRMQPRTDFRQRCLTFSLKCRRAQR